jgi:hypothetical protein
MKRYKSEGVGDSLSIANILIVSLRMLSKEVFMWNMNVDQLKANILLNRRDEQS